MSAPRVAGAALVAALHAAMLALLLQASFAPRATPQPHETIIHLTPPKPPAADRPAPPPRAPVPVVRLPALRTIPLPRVPGVDPKALESFGRALVDCRPENIASLPPEERHRCDALSLKPRDGVDFADHTDKHSADAALWARGRMRKNGPLLLPCMNNQGLGVGLGTLLCLGKGLAKGFKPDEQALYGDVPEQIHVPNNGDPRPPYVDPDHY
ncbi:MAG: hypothetical protein JOZ72_01705 [Alphaproteobacteria bacterium]|nr:hypothetical protein [Alphaproteobacteria bacterium]